MTEADDRQLRADVRVLREDVAQVKQAVLGVGGHDGLMQRVGATEDRISALERFKAALPVSILAIILSFLATLAGRSSEQPTPPPDVIVTVLPPTTTRGNASGASGEDVFTVGSTPSPRPSGSSSPSPSPSPTRTNPPPPPPPPVLEDVCELLAPILARLGLEPVACPVFGAARRDHRRGH